MPRKMTTQHRKRTQNPIYREKPILLGFVVLRKGSDGRLQHRRALGENVFDSIGFIHCWLDCDRGSPLTVILNTKRILMKSPLQA